jgi:mono/diheme cytochrome c family protein
LQKPPTTILAVIGLGLSLALWSLAAVTNPPTFKPKPPEDSLWPEGRYVYQRNCLICHGANGDGRGELGLTFKPPPRNFGRGIFKYRSTAHGFLPTNSDLARTIRGGLPGTVMPAFNELTEREVKSVIEYLKSFSSRWRKTTNYAPALVLPSLPAWFEDVMQLKSRAAKGAELFKTACSACHGPDGSGRGATAQDLEDSFGQPATLSDLRLPELRNGSSLEVVYRVLQTGIDTAPMPSFASTMTEEQRWELVAFIAQLRRNHAAEIVK